jgi:cytochrome c oxidase cbb3-type subunit 3
MKSVLAAALMVFICTPAVLAAGSGDAAAGKDTYGKHCLACHGADASGNTPIAKGMKVTIPNLASKEVQALSDADLQKVMTQGKGKMPPVKDLTDADLHNLVAYIRTLARK